MSELPKTLATNAERAQADAFANNLLNAPETAEVDPYVHGGPKIDWFNRSESYDDIDARLDRQALEISDTRRAAQAERKRAQKLLREKNL